MANHAVAGLASKLYDQPDQTNDNVDDTTRELPTPTRSAINFQEGLLPTYDTDSSAVAVPASTLEDTFEPEERCEDDRDCHGSPTWYVKSWGQHEQNHTENERTSC
jgi:hypothetical protein